MQYTRIVFLFIALQIIPHVAWACSCGPSTIDERIARSDVIFSGAVTEISGASGGQCGSKTATVKVNKMWKGKLPDTISIPMEDGCIGCGMYLSNGATYLIYGDLRNGVVMTGMCSGSRIIEHVSGDVAILDEYQKQIQILDQAITSNSKQIAPLLKKMDFLLGKKDYGAALPLAQQAAQLPGAEKMADVWQALGQSLQGTGNAKQAIEAYEKAVKLNPGDRETLGLLQKLRVKEGLFSHHEDGRNLNFVGEQLRDIHFKAMDLRGVDFSGSSLHKVDFTGANLEGANFTGVQLSEVNFTNATFTKVQVKRAAFYAVMMDNTRTEGTDFTGAQFTRSTLRNMKLNQNHSIIKAATGDSYALWENLVIKGVDLSNVPRGSLTLKNVTFDSVNMYQAAIAHSTFTNVVFKNTNLEKFNGSLSNMRGTVFENTSMKMADFRQSYLDNATFIRTDPTGADFFASSLKEVKFKNMILSDVAVDFSGDDERYKRNPHNRHKPAPPGKTSFYMAIYDCKTEWPKGIDPSKIGAILVDAACSKGITPLDLHGSEVAAYGANALFVSRPIPEEHRFDFTNGMFRNANMTGMTLRGIVFDGADFRGADLSGTELTNSSLVGVDFTGAKLEKVNLKLSVYDCKTKWPDGFDYAKSGAYSVDPKCSKGADFRGVSFNRAERQNAQLQNANMEGVDFLFANLQAANLSGANLRWANVDNARFGSANLANTDFSNANLTASSFEKTNLKKAILTNALMDRVQLAGVDMSGTNHKERTMREADLKDANFENADFEKARLERTQFHGANLKGVNFKNADLKNAEFQNRHYSYFSTNFSPVQRRNNYEQSAPKPAIVEGADFVGANLESAYLGEVDFSKTNLRGATLTLALFSCGAKWPKGFVPTAQGALLEEPCKDREVPPTDLSGENLRGKIIVFANLQGADLRKTDFQETKLHDVNFTGADLDGANFLLARYNCEHTIWPEGFDPGKQGALPEGGKCKDKPYSMPDLSRADLRQHNLRDISLAGVNLSGADLRQRGLISISLVGVNLSGADLRQASLERSDLTNANVSGAKLQGANLYGVNFHKADLRKAQYDCSTKWPYGFNADEAGAVNKEGKCPQNNDRGSQEFIRGLMQVPPQEIHAEKIDLSNQNLTGNAFVHVNFNGANLSGSNANWTNFRSENLKNINFKRTSLRGAALEGNFEDSNFNGADLTNATLRGSVKGATFRNSILINTKFADYTGIEQQDLTGSKYDCRTFWGSNVKAFDPKAKGAVFEGKACH